jgi:hypothetical protein
MTKASFRQGDLARIFRAAKQSRSIVQINLKTFMVTVLPPGKTIDSAAGFAPDGPEDWSRPQGYL